jgi:hypothetical protein
VDIDDDEAAEMRSFYGVLWLLSLFGEWHIPACLYLLAPSIDTTMLPNNKLTIRTIVVMELIRIIFFRIVLFLVKTCVITHVWLFQSDSFSGSWNRNKKWNCIWWLKQPFIKS